MRAPWGVGFIGSCLAACSLPGTITLLDAGDGATNIDATTDAIDARDVAPASDVFVCTSDAACSVPHGSMGCVAGGLCTRYTCDPGFYDLDRQPSNGCEYACTPTAGADFPDPLFQDTNCDGIDGDIGHAIFVSEGGSDTSGDGTMSRPYATLSMGITTAAAQSRDVYVDRGTYRESVTLASGVNVFGGYNSFTTLPGAPAGFWGRGAGAVSTIQGGSTAITATGFSVATMIDAFTILAANGVTTSHGEGTPSIGVLTTAPASASGILTLRGSVVTSGTGGAGGVATPRSGAAGLSGLPGLSGPPSCGSINMGGTPLPSTCMGAIAQGGRGGDSGAMGHPGGGGANGGPPGSAGGCGFAGGNGTIGTSGTAGAPGMPATTSGDGLGTVAFSAWVASNGGDGTAGHDGTGGGGGGGGGSAPFNVAGCNTSCPIAGGGGGAGGTGGCGGSGGLHGFGGGGSFAVAALGAAVILMQDTLTAGNGGPGGAGSPGGSGGGPGGPGGPGAPTVIVMTQTGPGGPGGAGGAGGAGGPGGGGGGGPSFTVIHTSDVTVASSGCTTANGMGGAGGVGGVTGSTTGPMGATGQSGAAHTY